jgi:hypothetical protein
MTASYDDGISYELAQMDRAALLQMAQRRGACVSDIALEVASWAAAARAALASADSQSDPGQARESRARTPSRLPAFRDNTMRNAA